MTEAAWQIWLGTIYNGQEPGNRIYQVVPESGRVGDSTNPRRYPASEEPSYPRCARRMNRNPDNPQPAPQGLRAEPEPMEFLELLHGPGPSNITIVARIQL
jgi:hypothetical protein